VKLLADPYRDLDVIDSRAPRFNQATIGVLSVLAVATGWWWLLGILAAQLAILGGLVAALALLAAATGFCMGDVPKANRRLPRGSSSLLAARSR